MNSQKKPPEKGNAIRWLKGTPRDLQIKCAWPLCNNMIHRQADLEVNGKRYCFQDIGNGDSHYILARYGERQSNGLTKGERAGLAHKLKEIRKLCDSDYSELSDQEKKYFDEFRAYADLDMRKPEDCWDNLNIILTFISWKLGGLLGVLEDDEKT